MKYTYWASLTTVVLMSSVGIASASQTKQLLTEKQVQTEFLSQIHEEVDDNNSEQVSVDLDSTSTQKFPSVLAQTRDVEKVGEYQSNPNRGAVIAKIETHTWNQRPAATLYVRDLPILTFIESSDAAASAQVQPTSSGAVKLATDSGVAQDNPIWQATTVAAQLNQLHQNRFDADTIKVRWDGDRQQYIIQANNQELIALNRNIILPDSTKNPAQDALQATNRLRRQIGNASPLKQVEGLPQPATPVARNPIRALVEGLASWYGPGFHGAQTASGEYFNQNALTAAHRTLPFGTKVRVTNVNNGRSVVVRINDRGPFTGGRVIDLSAAAAQAIGMISSGVAPVQVEVLSATRY